MFTVVNVALSAQGFTSVCCTRVMTAEWLVLVLLEGDANLLSSSYNTSAELQPSSLINHTTPMLTRLMGEKKEEERNRKNKQTTAANKNKTKCNEPIL